VTEVLLVASSRPQFGVLADSVRKFNAQGAHVYLGATFHLDAEAVTEDVAALELAGRHQLPRNLNHRSQALRRRAQASSRSVRV